MDTMLRRRQMMAKASRGPYKQNGLVFWLDGIEKGGNPGAWTDLIGGIRFENHGAVFGANMVSFDGSSYLENDTAGKIAEWSNATIETVFSNRAEGRRIGIVFTQNIEGSIGFWLYENRMILTYVGTSGHKTYSSNISDNSPHVCSISPDMGILDGDSLTFTSGDYIAVIPGQISYIGARTPSDNLFNGDIYSIRIYNRKLSQAEMLFNQQIDNQRFNLGLNI